MKNVTEHGDTDCPFWSPMFKTEYLCVMVSVLYELTPDKNDTDTKILVPAKLYNAGRQFYRYDKEVRIIYHRT